MRVAAVALAAMAVHAFAQAPAPKKPAVDDSPRFEIRRFLFEGATLVPREQLEESTRPFTGPKRTFADVQRALEVVERAYSDAGWSAVQIVLPEQELERGEIRFQIVEAKIGRVLVEGNKFFDEANIRSSVPALQPGSSPNINEIARNLRVANESPSKQATVLLRSGQEEATVDAVLRVVDERPYKFSITVDNTGNAQTGRLRTGFGVQHANIFELDHVLTVQYVTAPYSETRQPDGTIERWSLVPSKDVTILGIGYRIPLYRLGDSLDFTFGYSNVNSGTVQNLFTITGQGVVLGARYTRNLDRIGDYDHRAAFSLDYRSYENKGVRPVGGTIQLVPDVVVHPITLLYGGVYRQQNSETGFTVSWVKNFAGGNDGRGSTFCASRNNFIGQCGNANYSIFKYSLNHNQALPSDWQMRLGLNAQYTDDMLVSGEQFGVGGADSVRGFFEREVSNDVGYRATAELYTPDFGGRLMSGARARAVGFVDWGGVRRNQPGPAELHGQHISSVGIGLRFSRGTNMALRLDYGVVTNEGGSQNVGDTKLHASFSYLF
jgi:hemolysin activation/secretion protein